MAATATATSPDPLLAVPPPAELRRVLADLTRRRTLLQALLRASVRIANYPPPSGAQAAESDSAASR